MWMSIRGAASSATGGFEKSLVLGGKLFEDGVESVTKHKNKDNGTINTAPVMRQLE